MCIETLLDARAAGQLDVTIGGSVNRFLREADGLGRRAAFGIGLVACLASTWLGNIPALRR